MQITLAGEYAGQNSMQRATLEISWPAGGVSGERERVPVVGSQALKTAWPELLLVKVTAQRLGDSPHY